MRQKQYTMDLNTLLKLGEGREAAVFALDKRRALKLFLDGYSAQNVETAFISGRRLHRCGVLVPRMIEHCTVNGLQALIMERVDGESMLQSLFAAMETGGADELLDRFADIHRSILAVRIADAPTLKDKLRWQLQACGNERFLPRLQALPDGDMLCHFDFHPGNVLIYGGNPYVIDFMSCRKGAPILDIARTYYLMSYGALELIDAALHLEIGKQYLQVMGVKAEEIADALPVVMAARLSEDPTDPEREVISDYLRNFKE